MAKNVYLNRIFAWGTRRLSADSNALTLETDREKVPNDDVESAHKKVLPGAFTSSLMFTGGTSVDLELRVLQDLEAGTENVFTACQAANGAVGSMAVLQYGPATSFKWSGDFGARREFEIEIATQMRLAHGYVMFQSVGTAGISGATTGTGVELGAIPAGSEGLFSYHGGLTPPGVTGTTPTLDGVLESDADDTWASPVTRATLTQAGADGISELITIDGDSTPITDTWWRFKFSAPGGTGSPVFYALAAGAIRTKLT